MRSIVQRLLILLIVLFCLNGEKISYAQGEAYDVPYLIVDRTITPWGHKFFNTFIEFWEPPKGIKGYTITISEEKPSFKQSWIVVTVGDNIFSKKVYVVLLKPTTSEIDMQRNALEAAKRVLRYLLLTYLKVKKYETF